MREVLGHMTYKECSFFSQGTCLANVFKDTIAYFALINRVIYLYTSVVALDEFILVKSSGLCCDLE